MCRLICAKHVSSKVTVCALIVSVDVVVERS